MSNLINITIIYKFIYTIFKGDKMDNKINELKKNLPKESCSFCTHLSLDGPDENLKYNVKCVIFDRRVVY